ncbi:hypothetical protein CQJ32_11785 [Adlercreutzia equolifaciens subsp. celatus]|nr:hypothetical protein CQJ32_11785 [Adlercreutzia equolifaciens subsp. celatus]
MMLGLLMPALLAGMSIARMFGSKNLFGLAISLLPELTVTVAIPLFLSQQRQKGEYASPKSLGSKRKSCFSISGENTETERSLDTSCWTNLMLELFFRLASFLGISTEFWMR